MTNPIPQVCRPVSFDLSSFLQGLGASTMPHRTFTVGNAPSGILGATLAALVRRSRIASESSTPSS